MREVASKLGTYDWRDIRRELVDLSTQQKTARGFRLITPIPTDRQIQWEISHSHWSVLVEDEEGEERPHYNDLVLYRYRGE